MAAKGSGGARAATIEEMTEMKLMVLNLNGDGRAGNSMKFFLGG